MYGIEAEDQTSPGGRRVDQGKGVDGKTGEVLERCFGAVFWTIQWDKV